MNSITAELHNLANGSDHALAAKICRDAIAEIERLRRLEGTNDHPEHRCQCCGGRNISSWYADSDVWNRVAGDYNVLCPICFSELALDVGMEPTAWRLSFEGDDPEVSKLRVALHSWLEDSARDDEVIKMLKLENERLRFVLEAWKQAIIRNRAYYVPEFARRLCDNIVEDAENIIAERAK